MAIRVPSKDPNAVDFYYFVWCDLDGTNDGGATDNGELQGATISTATVTGSGVTVDSSNKDAVTIQGVAYAANTIVTVKISGGTAETNATVHCRITTSDGRTLDQTIQIPIKEH